jgi:type II secretory pathway pseudopilin PulG
MKIKKKNGFSILAIILVIVVVIVAIGMWALSGKTNTSNTGDSSNSVLASTIVNDSSSIKLQYDTLAINGQSNIIFMPGQSAQNNILDPVNGIEFPNVPSKAINTDLGGAPTGIWVLNNAFNSNLGPSNPDTAIIVSGLKDGVCKAINKTLYGSDTIPEYGPASGAPFFTYNATSTNPNTTQSIDFPSGGVGVNSITWDMGCIRSPGSTDQNAFFRILKIK